MDNINDCVLPKDEVDDANVLRCAICGEELGEDDEKYETEEGILCQSCFDDKYTECEICGKVTPRDDLNWWGELQVCTECFEEHVPSFDLSENEEETEEAYQKMLKEYVGKQTTFTKAGEYPLECMTEYAGSVYYRSSVSVDERGLITDISRLTAEIEVAESERWSDMRPYPIDDDDYEYRIEEMLDGHLVE